MALPDQASTRAIADRADAADRIERVLESLDASVFELHTVSSMADVACLSASRFARIFRSLVGESPASYLRKRRLARCAWELVNDEEPDITRVAMDADYSSSSDFARSFRRAYGASPLGFREKWRGSPFPEFAAERGAPAYAPSLFEAPDFRVACIPSFGLDRTRTSPAMRSRYARLYRELESRDALLPDALVLGFTMDPPRILPLDRCRYLAAITAGPGYSPRGEIRVRTIACAGDYVRCPVPEGKAPAWRRFMDCAAFLIGQWLPAHRRVPDARPFIELHADLSLSPRERWELWIPVRAR